MVIDLSALAGGLLIGLAAVAMMLFNGRITGVSGIAAGLLNRSPERTWQAAFVLGLVLAGLGLEPLWHWTDSIVLPHSSAWYAVAGLLVGFGTRLGGGCTSGHGVCGIGRLSGRSMTATIVFMAVAALTVWVVRHSGAVS